MMKTIKDSGLQEHSLDAVCSFLTKQIEHWQDSRYTRSMLKALESEMQVDSARIVSFIDVFKSETGTDHEAVLDLVQVYIRALPSVGVEGRVIRLAHSTNKFCTARSVEVDQPQYTGSEQRRYSGAAFFRQCPTNTEVTQRG